MSQYIPIPAVAAGTWQAGVSLAANLPDSGNQQFDVRVALDDESLYLWTGSTWVSVSGGGGGGGASWGSITGTLSNQTDLNTALNGKASTGANSSITSMSGLTGQVGGPTSILFSQTATPTTPAANKNCLYFKSDGNIYMLNSSGTETQVNGGGGGGIGGATGSTDDALIRADGTGGATVQGSTITLDDTGTMTFGTSDSSSNRIIMGNCWISTGFGATNQLRLTSLSSAGALVGYLIANNVMEIIGSRALFYNDAANTQFRLQTVAGDSLASYLVSCGGTIYTDITPVSNTGTSEVDLISKQINGSSLATNGDRVEFEAFGTFAANGNSKRIRAYFGSDLIYDSGSIAVNGKAWNLKGTLVRTGTATQVASVTGSCGDALFTVTAYNSSPTRTMSANNNLKLTAECGASDDVTQTVMLIDYMPRS